MAIFHFHAQIIGRSGGRSAVAAAAYRSGSKLYCQRTGTTYDYRRKLDVIKTGVLAPTILAPPGAPDWVIDRQVLYNMVEAAEKRKDSQLLREFDLAIPHELDECAAKLLVLRWNSENFLDHGVVSDVAFHSGYKGRNRHAHVLTTLRSIDADGFSAKKASELNHPSLCEEWRKSFERLCNEFLEAAGSSERVSRLSLAAEGITRRPQRHMGPSATAMYRRGAITEEAWIKSLYKAEVPDAQQFVRDRIDIQHLQQWWTALTRRVVPQVGVSLQRVGGPPIKNRESG